MTISIIGDFIIEKYISLSPGFFCFRYLFLSVPAYIFLKGFKMKKLLFPILLSGVYLSLMHYSNLPNRLDSVLPNGWEAQTSLGFFYTLLLFVILSNIYEKVKTRKIAKYIVHLGTISWEIFLVQMVLLGSGVVVFVSENILQSIYWQVLFNILVVMLISIFGAKIYKRVLLTKILNIG